MMQFNQQQFNNSTYLIFDRHNVEQTPEWTAVSLVEYHLKFKLGFVLQCLIDRLLLLLGSFLAIKEVTRTACDRCSRQVVG